MFVHLIEKNKDNYYICKQIRHIFEFEKYIQKLYYIGIMTNGLSKCLDSYGAWMIYGGTIISPNTLMNDNLQTCKLI